MAARQGEIPGAWKLGNLWRPRLDEIEAYEGERLLLEAAPEEPADIFALSPGAEARRRNKEKWAQGKG